MSHKQGIKPILLAMILLSCLSSLTLYPQPLVSAQETSDPPNESSIIFSQLGIPDLTLQGPSDAVDIRFRLPATWQPDGDATLQLRLATFLADADADVDTESLLASGASLGILLNGTPLRTVTLSSFGADGANVSIPASVLRSPSTDGTHHLRIILGSGPVCTVDRNLGVAIQATSQIVVPHTVVALSTDLSMLPQPIFQHAIEPDRALIVVPDDPTPDELQAAMSVAAGFGRMTANKLDLALVPVGDLTTQLRNEQHLILVGTAAHLPLLDTLSMPAPVNDGAFALDEISPDDGIVQLITSPWNSTKAVLIVSGNSDIAVQKAAQAVSSGSIRTGTASDLAVVAEIRPEQPGTPMNANRSLADMGHPVRTLTGSGEQALQYQFALPDRQFITGDAYLNLFFNHAPTIDYSRSSATVLLNDQPVRGLDLSKESAQLNSLRITLPVAALRSGNNILEVRTNLVPLIGCSLADQADLWFTIWPDSLLHTPITPAQSGNALVSLNNFPSPFTGSAGLGTTALLVARDDVQTWNIAAQIASYLGQFSVGHTIHPAVAFADAVSETLRGSYDLIIIGQPDRLSVINELGDSLPVVATSNTALGNANNLDIVYRLSQRSDTGYLVVTRSPWQQQHTILAILGNSDRGVEQAAAALLEPAKRQTFVGDFAIIEGEQSISGIAAEQAVAVADQNHADAADTNQSAPVIVARPTWIRPVIGISLLLIIGMLGYGIYTSRRSRRVART